MTKFFNYRLTGTGWAEATFTSEKQTLSFEVSYLSDPLSDLFEALNRLTTGETNHEKVTFAEEPGEHSLLLTKQADNLKIEIFSSDEWEEIAIVQNTVTSKELVYSDTDTFENFTKTILAGTQDLLNKVSSSEYKKQWHLFEFPTDSFNKLKQLFKSAG
jgi:hypothetical protein